eukprot:TRINITY_DN34130_c0_g1_i1.p1 TRINITY_DN34130_c0_g1~~TRINITY_DN34130_c0_g1_i1.p1  ORF type:complete len:583 (-),score=89.14 TRINITY_DN34130_c0_g1_i1:397-2112(-)
MKRCVFTLQNAMLEDLGGKYLRKCLLLIVALFFVLKTVTVAVVDVAGIGEMHSLFTIVVAISFWMMWISLIVYGVLVFRAYLVAYRLAVAATAAAVGDTREKEDARMATRTAGNQLMAVPISIFTTATIVLVNANLWHWTWPMSLWTLFSHGPDSAGFAQVIIIADSVFNTVSALLLSGALSGALSGGLKKQKANKQRLLKRKLMTASQTPCDDERWEMKTQHLAGRAFSLAKLLEFYRGLGVQYMKHYSASAHTTLDVVREAIIPLSASCRCAYAEVMMNGIPTFPDAMVTHNWGNKFAHLVAAIVADALGEDEFFRVLPMLEQDLDVLEEWLTALGKMERTYWVCAFSVSQHDGICGGNPAGTRDSVSGLLHQVCECGKPKSWNDSPPLRADGQSIPCEMNKFDDMMEYLAGTNSKFAQVIAVDASFELFGRAWCVAEVAAAHKMGLRQSLKVMSKRCVDDNSKQLQDLRIENMAASRPEDVQGILDKIPNVDEFNSKLQELIFEAFADWNSLDGRRQIEILGRLTRWQAWQNKLGTKEVGSGPRGQNIVSEETKLAVDYTDEEISLHI